MTWQDDTFNLERHCPRLGHLVHFDYCRNAGDNREPCFKSLDCWWERFDVIGYFRHSLPEAAFPRLSQSSPPNKVASLVDLVHQARERCRK